MLLELTLGDGRVARARNGWLPRPQKWRATSKTGSPYGSTTSNHPQGPWGVWDLVLSAADFQRPRVSVVSFFAAVIFAIFANVYIMRQAITPRGSLSPFSFRPVLRGNSPRPAMAQIRELRVVTTTITITAI